MLLTITAAGPGHDAAGAAVPATDLGFLLHKHPDRVNSSVSSVGTAHVFYPESSAERCTVAVLLEVDPVSPTARSALGYLDDRPYAAGSLLAVALGRVFSTALAGRCRTHPDLVAVRWPLTVDVPALRCRGGADTVRRLVEPLGWTAEVRTVPLEETRPGWGPAEHLDVILTGTHRLAVALAHLSVLLPVLGDDKHYWVDSAEVEKLLRRGGDWLAGHPHAAEITSRYLKHRRDLVDEAVARLVPDAAGQEGPLGAESRRPLRDERCTVLLEEVRAAGGGAVADLGCGQGQLLHRLLAEPGVQRVVGTDVSARALQQTARRLRPERLPEPVRARLDLFQSSLVYRDARLGGVDVAVLSEVVEHVDPDRLPVLERVVFGDARPGTVLVTTPNAEVTATYPDLGPGEFRHPDHRFEWTRAQFEAWARGVAEEFGYTVRFRGIGAEVAGHGAPTQLAVLTR
ncbi:3' terminal RNA ribose 2'-O-methyltransferase Hen1 [Kineococcus gynurae]|uniref:Small RNA 2'-O-methyltransferase n=1 Tax=Kineococcus gynurae TaxID=452979 RepID=A0ABV5LMQ6_9ACTN